MSVEVIKEEVYKRIEENSPTTILEVEDVEIPSFKLRAEVDEKYMKELKQSIKRVGQLQPIICWLDENGRFFVLDGRYRLMALKDLGIKKVEAKLINGELGKALAKAMHAQVHKKVLNPLDYAIMAEEIKRQTGLSYDEIAKWLGISKRHLMRCRELYHSEFHDLKEQVVKGKMSLRRALKEMKERRGEATSSYQDDHEAWWNEEVECPVCHNHVPRSMTKRVCEACIDKIEEKVKEENPEVKSVFDREYEWQKDFDLDPDYSIECYDQFFDERRFR